MILRDESQGQYRDFAARYIAKEVDERNAVATTCCYPLRRDVYFALIFLRAGIYINNNLSSRALSSLYISRGLRISIRKNRRGRIALTEA